MWKSPKISYSFFKELFTEVNFIRVICRKWLGYEAFGNPFSGEYLFEKKTNCFFSKKNHIPSCSFTPISDILTYNKTRLLIQIFSYNLPYSLYQPSYLCSKNTQDLYYPSMFFLIQTCIKATHWEMKTPHFKQQYWRPRFNKLLLKLSTTKNFRTQSVVSPK